MKQSVLIVEPDLLTRWSLKTYLEPWFTVYASSEPEQAGRVAGERALDALIVSDAIPNAAVQQIEQKARFRNPCVRIIRTVSGPTAAEKPATESEYRLEKPFELGQLRSVLGVPEPVRNDPHG